MRYFDYAFAVLFAYAMMVFFINIPIFGAFIAYYLYEVWVTNYVEWREFLI